MLDTTDLKQISQIIKTELNQGFKEQDEKITEKFKEQDEKITQKFKKQGEIIAKKFKEQDERITKELKKQDDRITKEFKRQHEEIIEIFKAEDRKIIKEISNQMLVFEEHYGRALTIAVEGLNHRNSNIDVQNQKLDNLDKICNLNSAYVYNHEERIHNLEKAN